MSAWIANTGGWMCIVDAKTKREAWRQLRSRASSVGLLPSDVPEHIVRPATEEEIDWYRSMGGAR